MNNQLENSITIGPIAYNRVSRLKSPPFYYVLMDSSFQLRPTPEIHLIFNGEDYATVLWSQNIDNGDLPVEYPADLAAPGCPGVVDFPNMTKLSRMQRLYRWQPYLPFFPIHLHSTPWASRYAFKYDTLPLIQTGPTSWTLQETVKAKWASHAAFFITILSKWRAHIAMAPMSVDYQYSLRDYPIDNYFDSEKKARGYFWHYRTLLFMCFAEFSFVVCARPNWIEEVMETYTSKNENDTRSWVLELASVLGDFQGTKRAGVIVNVATMDESLVSVISRYQKYGVPVLMDVGHVLFRDNDPIPNHPLLTITSRTQTTYQPAWPTPETIRIEAQKYIASMYPWRCSDFMQRRAIQPLTVPRPLVEEAGGVLHQRPPTTRWINPATNEPTDLIRVAAPVPLSGTTSGSRKGGLNWVDFFEHRREVNERLLAKETPVDRQRRQQRLKDSVKINQTQSSGPSKKSDVYVWVEEERPAGLSMTDGWVGTWRREKVNRGQVEEEWEKYAPTQRVYDAFHNQWDLLTLLDLSACPDRDYDPDSDVEDNTNNAGFTVDVDEPVAYLDQIENLAPDSTIYSTVNSLSSQIAFLAPKRLVSWAYSNLGILCSDHLSPPMVYKPTRNYVGFNIEVQHQQTPAFSDLQEFVFYIVERKFDHPRMEQLSDLHPGHHSPLNLSTLNIRPVNVQQRIIQRGVGTTQTLENVSRSGYIISLSNDQSDFRPGWVLLVFNAITVVQIARNKWARDCMEDLIRHLVRHGIEFRTLAPVVGQTLSSSVLKMTQPPITLPVRDKKRRPSPADYAAYVNVREKLVWSPHCKAIFRYGGIIWRLAMESEGSFDDVIDSILDGPSELGSLSGEYFDIEGTRYYDDRIPLPVADTITGVPGEIGGKFHDL